MPMPGRAAACASVLVCSLASFAAPVPTSSTASVGVITFTIEDTDPNDGIDAGVNLDFASGSYFGIFYQLVPDRLEPVTTVFEGSCSSPCTQWGQTEPPGGVVAHAFTRPFDGFSSVERAENVFTRDDWSILLQPHTRAVFSFEAMADATNGGPDAMAVASAELIFGGHTFSDSITAGVRVFSFEVTSGDSAQSGLLARHVRADATLGQDVSPVPEPGTYGMVAAGLIALWLRRRAARTAARPATRHRCGPVPRSRGT